MGLFNKKRKSEVTEVDVYTEHGNEVHVFAMCSVRSAMVENGLNALSAVTILLPRMQNCLAAIRRRHPLTIDDYC